MKNISYLFFLFLAQLVFGQDEVTIPTEINNATQSNSVGIAGTRFYYPNQYEWKPDESYYQLKLAGEDSVYLYVNEEVNHSYLKRYENDVRNWKRIQFSDPTHFSLPIEFQGMKALYNHYPSALRKGYDAFTVSFGNDSILGEYTMSVPQNNERLKKKAMQMMQEMIWAENLSVDYEQMFGYTIDLSRSEFTQIMPGTRNVFYYLAGKDKPDLNAFSDFIMITTVKNKTLTEVKDDYLNRYPENLYYNVEVLHQDAKKVKKQNALQAEVLGKVDTQYFKDFYCFIEHNQEILVYKARLFTNDKRRIKEVKNLPEKIAFIEP